MRAFMSFMYILKYSFVRNVLLEDYMILMSSSFDIDNFHFEYARFLASFQKLNFRIF